MEEEKKEMTAGRKETAAGKKETTADRKETAADKKETTADRKQLTAAPKETAAGRKQQTADKKQAAIASPRPAVRKRKKRAYSPEELYRLKRPKMAFDGRWKKAFGCPPPTGFWIIWGNSGNGKSSFVMQLAKYLCRFGKVFFNSVEEDTTASFIDNVRRCRMEEVGARFKCAKLTLEELEERMSDARKEDIYIIDSFQAAKLTTNGPMSYDRLCERHPDRLVIFISRADGTRPMGRPAVNCMWDASVKIWVEGFKAYCKGRFTPQSGASFTIWEEGAAIYEQGKTKKTTTITSI